jgi:3-oxoadipate enol-lactonase
MPFFERAGQPRLYYELDDYTDPWADAPCILLQHGYARSSKFWRAMVPYLSRFYRVIRPDMRGLGRSGKDFVAEEGISLPAYRQDFTDLLDHLGIESVHLCGESSGGTLALSFAADCAQRVRTLTLISSPVYMTEEDKKSSLGGYSNRIDALKAMGARGWLEASNAGRRFPPDADPRMLEWTLDEMGSSDLDVLLAMFRLISNADATPYLPRITAPVLGLYPQGGVITKDEHLEVLREKLRDVRIVRVPSRYHSIQVFAPATCALHLLHFVSQHDGITCREP